jgi:hypothetical protein
MFQPKFAEKIQTHFMFNNIFFAKIVPLMRWRVKSIVEPDSPQIKVWNMRVACWTSKAKITQSVYLILTAFPLQQSLHDRASLLHFTYIVFLCHLSLTLVFKHKYFIALIRHSVGPFIIWRWWQIRERPWDCELSWRWDREVQTINTTAPTPRPLIWF